jgi:hypothetical protein
MKDIIKVIWFNTHTISIYLLPYLWVYSKYFIYFYFLIILSWKLNDNKCLISQLEYNLFGETFMGKEIVFKVPKHHRYILYMNYLIGFCYYLN